MPDDLQRGVRYQRPVDTTPRWYTDVLGAYARIHIGPITITIEIIGGDPVAGVLTGGGDTPYGPFGAVELEEGIAIAAEDIEAFTIGTEPPLDRSDELRGEG
jgi:hypothetical protein